MTLPCSSQPRHPSAHVTCSGLSSQAHRHLRVDKHNPPHIREVNDMALDLKGKLRKGLRIFGADDREYGTIDRYDDQYAYVGERKIPVSAFERMDKDRLYVGSEGRRYFETDARTADQGQI